MKKVLIIIAVIILIAGAGVGGYFYGNSKGRTKDSEKTTTPEETTTVGTKELDVTDPIVEETLEKINKSLTCNVSPVEYLLEKESINANDITNEEAMIYYWGGAVAGEDGEIAKIGEDKVLERIHSILGNNYKFEHKTYTKEGLNFKYDKTNKQYIVKKIPWGCIAPIKGYIAKYTNAVVEDDKLVVTYKILFTSEYESTSDESGKTKNYIKYYKDYSLKTLIPQKEIEYDNGNDFNTYQALENDHNLNLGSTYQFTFEKQDGEYVFVKSELMK